MSKKKCEKYWYICQLQILQIIAGFSSSKRWFERNWHFCNYACMQMNKWLWCKYHLSHETITEYSFTLRNYRIYIALQKRHQRCSTSDFLPFCWFWRFSDFVATPPLSILFDILLSLCGVNNDLSDKKRITEYSFTLLRTFFYTASANCDHQKQMQKRGKYYYCSFWFTCFVPKSLWSVERVWKEPLSNFSLSPQWRKEEKLVLLDVIFIFLQVSLVFSDSNI